eukprot:jgi/Botrbrau1/8109/Bobra.0308s0004.1
MADAVCGEQKHGRIDKQVKRGSDCDFVLATSKSRVLGNILWQKGCLFPCVNFQTQKTEVIAVCNAKSAHLPASLRSLGRLTVSLHASIVNRVWFGIRLDRVSVGAQASSAPQFH